MLLNDLKIPIVPENANMSSRAVFSAGSSDFKNTEKDSGSRAKSMHGMTGPFLQIRIFRYDRYRQTILLLSVFFLFFLNTSTAASATTITHLVVFGDSFSDHGSSSYGGFNRYSNGPVWPDYLSRSLCQTCLQDYAWGGAKTDETNYHGFKWSGLLWQINRYQRTTAADKTLVVIWAGINDLIDGKKEGSDAINNIDVAINQLVVKGVKHIAIFSVPDITFAPAYNNPRLPDYQTFSVVKETVKKNISHFNQALQQHIQNKQQFYGKHHQPIHLIFIDFSHFFADLIHSKAYQDIKEPWYGTYHYPAPDAYLWWDAWHPMTDVHQRIAQYVREVLKEKKLFFKTVHITS